MLSDVKIKKALPKDKKYKMADSEGLYLLVKPNGSKLWKIKYRNNGIEKDVSLGSYPYLSLVEAREKRFELKKLIQQGIDPNYEKKKAKILEQALKQNTFNAVAKEWLSKRKGSITERQAKKLETWIDKDISPIIGHMTVSEIKPLDILAVMKKIEARNASDVARRVLNVCSQVFRYAIPLGKCTYDVTVGISKTLQVVKRENFNCIDIADFPQLIKDIDSHKCTAQTKIALKLIAHTFVRTKELRGAKWKEICFKTKEWRIPAERMKMGQLHIVPLSRQAINHFKALKSIAGDSEFVFPNANDKNRVMSENTMLFALYDMNYRGKMTVHGFRQLASTILNENGFNSDIIERQLSHSERNQVRRAYNHAQYLSERVIMMQKWSDFIKAIEIGVSIDKAKKKLKT